MLKLNLLKPEQITDGVYQIWGVGSKVTVIEDDDGLVLIDAGGPASLKLVSSGLSSIGLSVSDIKLIAMTHYHPDHSGGLAGLIEQSGAKIAAHQAEADMFSRKRRFPSPYSNNIIARFAGPIIKPLYGRPAMVKYLLNDGDLLPTNQDIRAVHTPGHTLGSICYFVVSKKILVVGDALQYRGRKLSLPASYVTHDMDMAYESVKKMLEVDFETVCFGHYEPLRVNAHNEVKQLLNRAR